MTVSCNDPALHIVDELVANGARFAYRPAAGCLPASFTYELAAGGDRRACRRAIARAKADPALWRAVVAEIGARCGAGGAP